MKSQNLMKEENNMQALMMMAGADDDGMRHVLWTGGEFSLRGTMGASVAKVNDPYTPYDDVITLTKGATVIGAGSLPSGDDFGNNVFTRYLENTQNIKTEVAWSVDSSTYNSKVAMCITSGSIPDILVVNRSIFNQLVENDLVADLTQAYADCISPFLKEQYDRYDHNLFEQVTVDGKLMGLPSPSLNNCQNVFICWNVRASFSTSSRVFGTSKPVFPSQSERIQSTF